MGRQVLQSLVSEFDLFQSGMSLGDIYQSTVVVSIGCHVVRDVEIYISHVEEGFSQEIPATNVVSCSQPQIDKGL